MNSEFQPPKTYRTIAVIGSGVMGTGIALAGASADCEVMIWDLSDAILADAMSRIDGTLQVDLRKGRISAERKGEILARITPVRDIEDVGAVQCVIEAAPERMDIKRDVFARLSAACAPDCVLATNTSSLSITAIAAAASHPERVIGMHFFNPAHAMRLVEVVPGRSTSDGVVESIMRFAAALGKTPVKVKDSPGFIVNRVARPFYNEALRILEEGIANAEAIDRILTAQGFRMGQRPH